MSLLSKIAAFWSDDRLTAVDATGRLAEQVRALAPDVTCALNQRDDGPSSLRLSDRLVVMLADCGDGVEARVMEPGLPGDDDPPMLLRAVYDITNLAHSLSWRARIPRGTVELHLLRTNAVYEVVQPFTDYHGQAFSAGARLTFVNRHFLPYHGGHTLCFREATIYLQEDDNVCRAFERYFSYAPASR